jgi:hypothetical protein
MGIRSSTIKLGGGKDCAASSSAVMVSSVLMLFFLLKEIEFAPTSKDLWGQLSNIIAFSDCLCYARFIT